MNYIKEKSTQQLGWNISLYAKCISQFVYFYFSLKCSFENYVFVFPVKYQLMVTNIKNKFQQSDIKNGKLKIAL